MEREGRLYQERAARRELTTTFPGQPQQQNQHHYHRQDATNSGQQEEHGEDSGLYASAGPPSIPIHAQGPQVLNSTAFKHENSQPLSDPTLSPALGGANSNPFPSQRPRACDSCRGLKVRCQPTDESNPFGTCKRCAKARRTCIFTPPSRKRQKKTDTRVDELEKKIEALTASLHAGVNARVSDVQSPTPSSADEDDEREERTNEGGGRAAVEARRSSESRGLSVGGLGEGGIVSSPKVRNISKKRSREDHDDNYNDDVDDDGGIDNIKDSPSSNPAMQPNKLVKPIISTPTERMENKLPEQGGTQAEHGEERSRGEGDDYRDVVDRGLLNMDLATEIFNRYVNEMVPLFPAVVFPPGTTAKEVRRTKPTVFLAILAIASGTAGEALHTKLNQEIVELLAERVLCKGEKSLGLIQSLVLCSAWYYPPAEKEELRFYQLVHMAAVMTMDIGINRRNGHLRKQAGGFGSMDMQTVPSTAPGTVWREHTVRNETRQFPDSSAIESRRTLLGAYYCCSAVAMGLRRQNIFRFTTYMGECVEILETSEDALPSDRVLAQWCKVQKIAEEISVAFLFDDPGANVSIQDLSVQFALRGFSRQLEQFNQVYLKGGKFFKEGEGMERSLKLAYYTTALNAHEIALHVNHNVDEFGPPYTEKMLRGPSIAQNSLLTSLHIDLLSRCLTSAYSFLDIFLSFSVEELRGMPVFHFVRGIYAAVILMKLFFSASAPMSELGEVLDKDSLRVDFYVTGLVRKLEEAASGGKSRSAEKFSRIFRLLQSWWEAQRVGIGNGKGEATAADVEETSKGTGKSYSAGNIVRHTGSLPRSPHTGLADGNGVGRHPSEAPHTPDTTASPVRLPPLQLASGGLSNEIPSTPPYTSSSAPTPSTESGGNDRANTPIPSASSIRQRQLLPSLPPPSSFTPNTPLQILSDVASSTRGNGVQMAGREVCMPSPTMVGSSRIQHHQHHLSMQSSPGLHNVPSQNVHQPMYAYPPQPQTTQTGMHGLPHLQGQQNGYFLMTPGAIGVENQHIEGMFTGAISGGYHFATSAATRAGYISSGTLGDRREGGGGNGAGYYAQGGIGEGRGAGVVGVGEVTGGNWTADDFFWSVMDGLPGSLDSGWGGGIAGGGAGASGGTSGGVG